MAQRRELFYFSLIYYIFALFNYLISRSDCVMDSDKITEMHNELGKICEAHRDCKFYVFSCNKIFFLYFKRATLPLLSLSFYLLSVLK
jgi:hypothetical protein